MDSRRRLLSVNKNTNNESGGGNISIALELNDAVNPSSNATIVK